MSVAAKESVLLSEILDEVIHLQDPIGVVASSFMSKLETVLADPWAVAIQDYAYEHLENELPADFAEKLKFQTALTRLAAEDPAVHKLMTEVAQLRMPSSVLREPNIVEQLVYSVQSEAQE